MKDLKRINFIQINVESLNKLVTKAPKLAKNDLDKRVVFTKEGYIIIDNKDIVNDAIDADYEILPKETIKSKFLSLFRK